MHQKAGMDWALERAKHVDCRTWHWGHEDQLDKVITHDRDNDYDDDDIGDGDFRTWHWNQTSYWMKSKC